MVKISNEFNKQINEDIREQEQIKQAVESSPSMDQLQSDAPTPQSMQASALDGKAQQPMETSALPAPQSPSYQQPPTYTLPPSPRGEVQEQIQEVSESIINEKWEDLTTKLGDINIWKENVRNEIISIKQEVVRINNKFENLQNSVIGKVGEYNKNIQDMGTDIKALEKVFEKIIEPLTTNIRELNMVAEKLKGN